MRVNVEDIQWFRSELAKINRANLSEITFYETEMSESPIDIDPDVVDCFAFTGLSNVDFIATGYYLTTVKRD